MKESDIEETKLEKIDQNEGELKDESLETVAGGQNTIYLTTVQQSDVTDDSAGGPGIIED